MVNCPYCSHAFLKHDDHGCKSSGCDCKYKYTEYGWEKVRDPSLSPLREEDKIVLLAAKDKDAAIGKANLRVYGGITLIAVSILLFMVSITNNNAISNTFFGKHILAWRSVALLAPLEVLLLHTGLNARSRIMNNEDGAKL
jgi:hypothetical protein